MDSRAVEALIESVMRGDTPVQDAVFELSQAPFRRLRDAKLDTARELRSGFEEVVYAEGKDFEALCEITAALLDERGRVLLTRIPGPMQQQLRQTFPQLVLHPRARIAAYERRPVEPLPGSLAVISAGTSDAAVAEEAAVAARYFGLETVEINDVGVAGLSRLTESLEEIRKHDVLVVVAGMEGALPSVLGSLVEAPMIAVPTSVGYGTSFGGATALFSMLVSCSPGHTVVNIDNGFGAALAAAKMVRHLRRPKST